MLSPTTTRLIQEVFGYYREDSKKLAEEDPEACLISLLTMVKKRLPEASATLSITIDAATYDKRVEEARKQLDRETTTV